MSESDIGRRMVGVRKSVPFFRVLILVRYCPVRYEMDEVAMITPELV